MKRNQILITILIAILGIGLMVGAYFAYDYLSNKDIEFEKPIDLSSGDNVALEYEPTDKESAPPKDSAVVELEPDDEEKPPEEDGKRGDYADFTVYDKDNNKKMLSEVISKGKPVIINFWTTWCGYCKMEMPDFNEAYNEYKDDVEFMMIDICGQGQDDIDKAKAYVEEEGFDFPVYYDSDLSALYAYYTTGYPTTIIIDSKANVVYAQSGALSKSSLVSMIEQLI